jgi:signal transduction histidine kinase
MTAVITFSWYFILGPTMLQGAETNLAKVVGSAYPVFDLILIFCMLLLWFRESDPSLVPAERLLLAGLTIIVITDSIYGYLTLQNIYTNGLQDIGWPVGYMLLGLAAQCVTLAYVLHATRNETTSLEEASQVLASEPRMGKHSLLPYALIPAVIALSIIIWRSGGNGALEQGVYLGGIALIGLLLLRQFFVIRETTFYNKQLRVTQKGATSEAFSLASVTCEVINLFEPQKRLDYHIKLDIPETLFVRANKQYVHQVLLNLLSNAFKYSPRYTSIIVSAQMSDDSTANESMQKLVCVSVQDAGPGIPSLEASVLFGKFVRLKRDLVGSVRGTGLGLYISKQLVEAMGGNIWVESTGIAGQGSRFSFTLPYIVPDAVEQNSHSVTTLADVLPLTSTSMIPREKQGGVVRSEVLEP